MKKSFYIMLTALVGMFLFFILHRLVFFAVALLSGGSGMSFNAWMLENVTLILSLMGGIWYGVWIGAYWYDKIYVEKTHYGLAGHVASRIWPSHSEERGMAGRIHIATKKLEADLRKFESLASTSVTAAASPSPIKRTLVRKRAPRKLTRTSTKT